MAICETYDPDCYACRLRAKGLQLNAKLHAARRTRPEPIVPVHTPSWEAGVVTQTRPGGEVPVLRSDLTPWRMKEASEKSHTLTDAMRTNHALNQGV